MKEFFATPDVNASAVNTFFGESLKKDNEIHAMSIYIDKEKKLSFAAEPYSLDDKREIYSLSKSFTSCAIGAAWDDRLIDLDEKLVDIFPDKLPEKVSKNLSKMTVRHCLTMTTGHIACVMSEIVFEEDPAKAFLACDVPKEPGTYFVYNTGASCMLGLILERKTGRKLFDYAYEKILSPLGIKDATWSECASATNEGGIGLHISCRDIEKFGLMLANGGEYAGKRILSQEWVDMAGAAQVSNKENGDSGTGNWTSGYGFQFWRTAHDGYRGDGLKGQLCMVMPKHKAVVSIVACTKDMEAEIADAVTLVENLLGKSDETFDIPDYRPSATDKDISDFVGKTVLLNPNPIGLTSAKFEKTDTGIVVTLLNGNRAQTLFAGNGCWGKSELELPAITPKILPMMVSTRPEKVCVASSFTVENGKLVITARNLSNPHTIIVTAEKTDKEVTVHLDTVWFPEMLSDNVRVLKGKIVSR